MGDRQRSHTRLPTDESIAVLRNRYHILEPGIYYHVYNHAHGSEQLFRSPENCRFFMEKFELYVSPVADIFCYCLMPNHFHFLIRCKEEEELVKFFEERNGKGGAKPQSLSGFAGNTATLTGLRDNQRRPQLLSKLITLQFSHLFNAYTQSYNKMYGRMGGLFMRPFNRIAIKDMKYLQTLVVYIHRNPLEAGLCATPENYPHSSYRKIIDNMASTILTDEILQWFGTVDDFIAIHKC